MEIWKILGYLSIGIDKISEAEFLRQIGAGQPELGILKITCF